MSKNVQANDFFEGSPPFRAEEDLSGEELEALVAAAAFKTDDVVIYEPGPGSLERLMKQVRETPQRRRPHESFLSTLGHTVVAHMPRTAVTVLAVAAGCGAVAMHAEKTALSFGVFAFLGGMSLIHDACAARDHHTDGPGF